ncbi:Hint domain-containing protein [uncultured Dialister sp.]|uniref:Hint domain-containing protein n=1 Tax=uncultured Dialister sp. TaxID=278064 RepID=UPI00206DBBE2|nr:Hint domain-containing protein [uncultured Dialister sp.]DAE67614.1 MAG TPA: Hint domain [Caudoviricetes sp.]
MLKFNLQLFGGGKKSKVVSTSAKVPEASSEEKRVLSNEMDWLTNAMGVSKSLMNLANGQIQNSQVAPDYNSLLQAALSGTQQAGQTVSGLLPQVQSGVTGANDANSGYIGGIGSAMQTYQEGNKYLDSDYQKAMASNADTMSGLLSGQLPSAYSENRQKALQSDLDSTMGSTLSSLADRGIINSSVANQSMNDISKNAANALANSYSSDMAQAAGLANSAYNNQLNGLNGRAGLLSGLYSGQLSGIGQQAGLTGNNISNILNGASAQSSLAGQQANLANQPIDTAAAAQSNAASTPLNYFNAAVGLQSPNLSLYDSMSGHRYAVATPGQTYVKQGSGGWFGNLLGTAANSAAAYYACFPAGTMVATGHGDVAIEKMAEGDTVVIQGGHMAHVKKVHDMGEQVTYNVETAPSIDGTVRKVTTTATEVFLTPEGRKPLSALKAGMKVWTVDSFRRLSHVLKNKAQQRVYELELDDDRALFYANGFAVEPLTAKDKASNKQAEGKEGK